MKNFLYFLFYSTLGWIIEVCFVYYTSGILENRGFLFGPYLPIYGFGCMILILSSQKLKLSPFFFFLFSMAVCSVLEYGTSVLLEVLFHRRWWDYSNFIFQLHGRVCLETTIPFGGLSYFVVHKLHPQIERLTNQHWKFLHDSLFPILRITFFIDILLSLFCFTFGP